MKTQQRRRRTTSSKVTEPVMVPGPLTIAPCHHMVDLKANMKKKMTNTETKMIET